MTSPKPTANRYLSPPPRRHATSPFAIFCWCLFDWAHSAFSTVIITFVFSAYFTRAVTDSMIRGTSYWGWMIGLVGIVVAMLSPILGAIVDYTGRRKPCLSFLVIVCASSTALLWFTQPNSKWIGWALLFVAIAKICYEIMQLFYNAAMVSIAPSNKIGRISGWGWGLGYLGGLACLGIALLMFINANWLPTSDALNVRSVTLLVAVWLLIFSLPFFIFTPDAPPSALSIKQACQQGLHELRQTFVKIYHYKTLFLFLIAYLVYIDGLNTLFAFGGIFAAGTFHMSYTEILIFAIVLNVTAGLGAAVFAWIDDYIGAKFTIMLSLFALMLSGLAILLTHSTIMFWILATILGIFVGPTQAASRSFMAQIASPQELNQMFGLYNLSGRVSAFAGPMLLATITDIFNSQRLGMTIILVMFLSGWLLLWLVPSPQPKKC